MSDLQALINQYFNLGLPTYSRSLKAAEKIAQPRGTPQQIQSMLLKYGASPEELKWTGTDKLLDPTKSSVSVDDVLQQIANNQPKVTDYVNTSSLDYDKMQEMIDANNAENGADAMPIEMELKSRGLMPKTKFESYKTPSPYKIDAWGEPQPAPYFEHIMSMPGKTDFQSSHFPSVPDYHSHMRYQLRDDASGKPMLLLDELQSDLAQSGRDKGWLDDIDQSKIPMDLRYLNSRGEPRIMQLHAGEDPQDYINVLANNGFTNFEVKRAGNYINKPPLANTKDWTKYLMNRAMQIGAANDVDKVGWTTGAQQAARYDLGDAAGMAGYYDQMVPKITQDLIKKYGARIERTDIPTAAFYDAAPPANVHSFTLTPQMKEDLLTQGIPLFRHGGEVNTSQSEGY